MYVNVDVNVRVDADVLLDEVGSNYARDYFGLYDDSYVNDIEEGFQSDLDALSARITELEEENALLRGNV